MRKLVIIFSILAICFQANAQQQTKIGINLLIEKSDAEYNFGPALGLTIERQMTKRSGIESGLYYRTAERSLYLAFNSQPNALSILYLEISERFLSLPILYKFHSKVLNFAVGPTVDYFVGWNQLNGIGQIEIEDYSISPDLSFGAMVKLSKTIKLGEKYSLEPEVRLNPNITYGTVFFGFGVPLKFGID